MGDINLNLIFIGIIYKNRWIFSLENGVDNLLPFVYQAVTLKYREQLSIITRKCISQVDKIMLFQPNDNPTLTKQGLQEIKTLVDFKCDGNRMSYLEGEGPLVLRPL